AASRVMRMRTESGIPSGSERVRSQATSICIESEFSQIVDRTSVAWARAGNGRVVGWSRRKPTSIRAPINKDTAAYTTQFRIFGMLGGSGLGDRLRRRM